MLPFRRSEEYISNLSHSASSNYSRQAIKHANRPKRCPTTSHLLANQNKTYRLESVADLEFVRRSNSRLRSAQLHEQHVVFDIFAT